MANSKFLLGVLAAAAAGVAIGILMAPKKGSDARKKISEKASGLASMLGDWVTMGKDKLEETSGTLSQKANQVV